MFVMINMELIAEYLCNHQPYPIRDRLLKDKDFLSHYNLQSNSVIIIGGKIHVDQKILLHAISHAFKNKKSIKLLDLDGKKHFIRIDQGYINLESSEKNLEGRLNHFYFLSPNKEERNESLKKLIKKIGPMAPDFSNLLAEAENTELNYGHIDQLLCETYGGVVALQNRTRNVFNSQSPFILADLVPDTLKYYDYFCGPDPDNTDPIKYIGSVLPSYRKMLIQRDKMIGLDISLQGALRDDLMPGNWVMDLSDDELWDILETCDPFRDPFALLGALDIALLRQKDKRYMSFAEKAIPILIKNEFCRADGVDVYDLLPTLAGLVFNRINTIEGGALRPPYWKRMCAWMQAGFIIRQTQKIALNLESLKNWVSANVTQSGNFACLLDLQKEPMYQATEMSQAALRKEILGRIFSIRNRYKKEGIDIPNSDEIDNAISGLKDQGTPLDWALPGPLEGNIRPVEKGDKLPEEGVNHFIKELFGGHPEKALSVLTHLSQLIDLGEDLLLKIRDVILKTNFEVGFEGFPELLKRIIDVGFISGAHRDMELSKAIGSKIVATTPFVNSDYQIINVLQALLIAGSGFQNEIDWAIWLEKQLVEVACRLPDAKTAKNFLHYMKELKKVLNLKRGITSQAEAIASAAI
jgi:hypothetical protein